MQRRVRRSIPYTVIFLSVILYIDRGPHTRFSGGGVGVSLGIWPVLLSEKLFLASKIYRKPNCRVWQKLNRDFFLSRIPHTQKGRGRIIQGVL